MESNAATEANGAAPAAKPKTLEEFFDRELALRSDRFDTLLDGTGISVERFKLTAIRQMLKSAEVQNAARKNPASFIDSVIVAAEQGLDFSRPNEAHLVPIGDGVTLFRGYKGIIKMARRSPRIADIDAQPVFERDVYQRTLGTNRSLIHEPPAFGQSRGKLIGFYAIAYLTTGAAAIFDEMSVEQIEAHAKRFVKAKKGPFAEVKNDGRTAENFEPYGLKTVLIRLCHRKLDLSSELGGSMQSEYEAEGDAIDVTPEPQATEPEDINAKLKAARAAKAAAETPKTEPELELEPQPNEIRDEDIAAEQEMAS